MERSMEDKIAFDKTGTAGDNDGHNDRLISVF